ncbi:MAG: TonB-dependent siderophore receptor, partial [Verrucomicrobia bacterium]|nr:TonB-dependent siderophore receptor [Verrucomicrobiota bacterium]
TYRWSPDTWLTFKVEVVGDWLEQDLGLIPVFQTANATGESAGYTLARYNTVYQEPTDKTDSRGHAFSGTFHTRLNDRWTVNLQSRFAYVREWIREETQLVGGTSPTLANPNWARQYNYNDGPHRYWYSDANAYATYGPEKFQNTILVGTGGGVEFTDVRRISFGPTVAPINVFHPTLGLLPYPADGTRPNNPKQWLTSFGVYVSDNIKLVDRWHLSVGTRYDQQISHSYDPINPVTAPYVHQNAHAITSQGGVVFDLTRSLSAYASVSQSFKPQAVTTVDAGGVSGFPPEKGFQKEAGFKFEAEDHKLNASIAAYEIVRTDVAVSTGLVLPVSGLGIFRLDGEQRSRGVELETEWQPLPNWQMQAGLALGHAYVSKSTGNPATVGTDLVTAPRRSGSFWTRYNFTGNALRGLGAGLGVIYVGRQWSPGNFVVPGWVRADGHVYYDWKRYKFGFSCENLFDRRYIQIARARQILVPGNERRLTFSLTARY